MKKIEEAQLTELNNIIKTLKYLDSQIAGMRVEESRAVEAYKELLDKLEKEKASIREEHGDVEIDLATGELKEPKQEE
jgi:hypothetical protein